MPDQLSVASHLQIPLEEYDARIRTFIPHYEEMLGELGKVAASSVVERPVILDLGIGTGALSEVCLKARPEGKLIGINSDPAMERAEEDTHFPLADELEWLNEAGFRTDVVWRKDLFAVLVCS